VDSSLIFDDQLVSFSALTLLVSYSGLKNRPEMTCNVSSGMLNHTHSLILTIERSSMRIQDLTHKRLLCLLCSSCKFLYVDIA